MKKTLLSFLILSLSINTNAEETKLNQDSDQYSNEKIDEYHEDISDYINDKTELLDEIISNYEKEKIKTNKSYALLNVKQSVNSLYDNENKIDLKLKVHLPYTEDKWNFFLDTSTSDFDTLEDKIRETFVDDSDFSETTKSSLVGFIFDDLDHKWKRSYKFGVKFKFPLDPFFKINIYNKRNLTDNIEQYFNQEFFIYSVKGEGLKTNLDYTFTAEDQSIYSSNSSFQYLNNSENELEATQQFSKWNRVSSKGTLKHTIGFSGSWDDNGSHNNYWLNTRYRHLLYKDWLYGKVIPEISFDKDYDYKANYGILFQLEIFFAKQEALNEITGY